MGKFSARIGWLVRITVGGILLVLAVSISLPYFFSFVGTESVVNGRLVILRTPIEGKVTVEPPPVGSEVNAGAIVAVVENDRQDRSFVNELRTEHSTLKERIDALDRQAAEMNRTRDQLADRTRAFRVARLAILDRGIDQAIAQVRTAEALDQERSRNLSRTQELVARGHVSNAALDEAEATARQTHEQVAQAKLAVDRLREERSAVERGVFVDSSQNDVPYSLQRMDEITLRTQDIQARRREYEIRVSEIERQMKVEDDRLATERLSVQRVPRQTVVWQRSVAQGNDVVIGSELMQLLDCDNLFLDVNLDERHFESIRPGQRARVRLRGSDKTLEGVVEAVRGGNTSARDTLAVANLANSRDGQLTVTVSVNKADLADAAGTFCSVGRTATVSFDRPSARVIQHLMASIADTSWFGKTP